MRSAMSKAYLEAAIRSYLNSLLVSDIHQSEGLMLNRHSAKFYRCCEKRELLICSIIQPTRHTDQLQDFLKDDRLRID